ncbi:spore germination protein [Neobacillus niacini]|uniref:spore germination protein n=1 Tax=Neobacillus niacini TaxID=86668 RepID=UPI001C8EF9D0|nr:spore germination protein [Neobacillus niacini]MBY0147913.1 spore germination protein [Neobacillus niacini]
MGRLGKSDVIDKLNANDSQSSENINRNIGNSIIVNEAIFKKVFQHSSDIMYREITIHSQTKLLLIYVDGMVNTDIIISNILEPLMYKGLPQGLGAVESVFEMFEQERFSVLQTKKVSNIDDISEHILKGNLAILVDGENIALLADVKKIETRSISDSAIEPVLRGSRESFTENLRTNTTMLRRILATPNLKIDSLKIGKLTKTDVAVVYIEGIVKPSVLNDVKKRLKQIQTNAILESGIIEQYIEEDQFSPFPQILNSERPDVVAAGLLEGRVAIITNGTPFALIVPMTFWSGLQAPDDYHQRFLFVAMIRWVRYIFTALSVFLPSIFIALTNFHPEMVPPDLMLNIAALRERAPFPTVIEVLLMEFMFEGLQEAGLRLPKQIGPLVSIVGALVIGEAAVSAGIISAPVVIVVATGGIAAFIIPRYSFSFPLRMLRFPLIILSGTLGIFGIAIGISTILIHLLNLQSFGTPYLSPVAPLNKRGLKDVLIRWPKKLVKNSKGDQV